MSCILVVDDDEAITEFVQAALEYAGYDVLAAVDGDALSLAHAKQPDVILLDLLMPGMSGEEVCEHLREDAATALIPVVAMSAAYNLDAIAERAACSDRLAKPFSLSDLYDKVERWAAHE